MAVLDGLYRGAFFGYIILFGHLIVILHGFYMAI